MRENLFELEFSVDLPPSSVDMTRARKEKSLKFIHFLEFNEL